MSHEIDQDHVLCECDLGAITQLVEELERQYQPRMVREPAVCLTMVRAQDTIEGQEFYLGEAATTECEVEVSGQLGYGVCLGEEPQRAYCLAVIDAVIAAEPEMPPRISVFLRQHRELLIRAEREEFSHTLRSQVDFHLFDEE